MQTDNFEKLERLSDFEKTSVTIPRPLMEILRATAKEKKLSVSHLLWIAIDNELDAKNPFDYQTPKPATIYVPYAYAGEANRVLSFLRKYSRGITLPMLVLMRRSYGIANPQVVLLALRELLHTKAAMQSTVSPKGSFYEEQCGVDPVWIRPEQTALKKLEKERSKLVEEKAKLDKKQEKLDHQEAVIKNEGKW